MRKPVGCGSLSKQCKHITGALRERKSLLSHLKTRSLRYLVISFYEQLLYYV